MTNHIENRSAELPACNMTAWEHHIVDMLSDMEAEIWTYDDFLPGEHDPIPQSDNWPKRPPNSL